MMRVIKQKIQDLLKAITAQNQKQFGKERMDCCEMNKRPTNKK